MQAESRNQAVLISGESGAGKTEAAKLIMSYVGGVSKSGEDVVMKKVMQTNPVLEAFGNAQTVRNSNSSRFGKWIDLCFTKSFASSGCSVTQYLLETTRVCHQAEKERNFHVFFQLLQARDTAEFKHIGLEGPKKYRYLKNGQEKARNVDDTQCFAEINAAFNDVGISKETQTQIWHIVAAVLVLGNGEFKADGEGSAVSNQAVFDKAAELLGVDVSSLTDVFLYRLITVGKDTTQAKNRPEQASGIRDTIARLIYGLVFRWLVSTMSEAMQSQEDAPNFIGVLDIAGFECFEINTFEQLHINLSNEHLQQQFNSHVLKSEMEECKKEGVQMPDIGGFVDNEEVLALIANKGGVLEILDEVCAASFSSATVEGYVNKVGQAHKAHPCLVMPKISTKPPTFTIKHFAGPVKYTVADWLDRNTEKLPQEATDLLGGSSLELLQLLKEILVADSAPEPGSTGRAQTGKKKKSVSSSFRSSLRELMLKIHAASPHYIRCIKPNPEHVPGRIVSKLVMEQMLFAGVFAAITVRQQGYAIRVPHKDFVFVYGCIVHLSEDPKLVSQAEAIKAAGNDKDKAIALVASLPDAVKSVGLALDDQSFAVGFTKIFIRFAASCILEKARSITLKQCVTKLGRYFRGNQERRRVAKIREAMVKVQKVVDTCGGIKDKSEQEVQDSIMSALGQPEAALAAQKELSDAISDAVSVGARNFTLSNAERMGRKLACEIQHYKKVEGLCVSIDPVLIEATLTIAKEMKLPELEGSAVLSLERRLANLKIQLPMIKDFEAALEMSAFDPNETIESSEKKVKLLDSVMSAAKAAGLSPSPNVWVSGLNGPALFDKLEAVLTKRRASIKMALDEISAAAEIAATARLAAKDKVASAHGVAAKDEVGDAEGVAAKDEVGDAEGVAAKDEVGVAEGVEANHEVAGAEGLAPKHEVAGAEGLAPKHEVAGAEGPAPKHEVGGKDVFLSKTEADADAAGVQSRKQARTSSCFSVTSQPEWTEKVSSALADAEKRLLDKFDEERAKTEQDFMKTLREEMSRLQGEDQAGLLAMAEAVRRLGVSCEEVRSRALAAFEDKQLHLVTQLNEVKAKQFESEREAAEKSSNVDARELADRLEKEKEEVRRLEAQLDEERQKSEKEFNEGVAKERQKAEVSFKTESPEKASMRRRRTIPGLVVSERSQIIEKLSVAVATYDIDALDLLLTRVVDECIEDEEMHGPIAVAKEFYANFQTERFVLMQLEKALNDNRGTKPPLAELWRLHRLHEQLGKLVKNQFHGEHMLAVCIEAAELLQTTLASKAKSMGWTTILESNDADEKALAESVFSDMIRYYKLKIGDSWNIGTLTTTSSRLSLQGSMHRRSTKRQSLGTNGMALFTIVESEVPIQKVVAQALPGILEYSEDAIDESLTRPSKTSDKEAHDDAAVTTFLNIMLYMNTKPTSKTQKESCITAVVKDAMRSSSSGEEIVLQVMKQVNGNDSNLALKLGWELLARLFEVVPPGPVLCEFARVFIQEKEEDLLDGEETEVWAQTLLPKCREILDNNSRGTLADVSKKAITDAWEGVSWIWAKK
eukprot:TRINITY_DN21316_c0_g1_i1.p1 TRINITY_DN21316_c0_g1~~TRINITY_DN21316_c0_g1_i1.p1  ORF type:complete len:1714 (-),score=390.73 TRINITY_DN21316_c0_g1_i1:69-4754(-)